MDDHFIYYNLSEDLTNKNLLNMKHILKKEF
jgi:hypothetical protein